MHHVLSFLEKVSDLLYKYIILPITHEKLKINKKKFEIALIQDMNTCLSTAPEKFKVNIM